MEITVQEIKPKKPPVWKDWGPALLLSNPKHFDRDAVIELKRICYDTPYPDSRGINERDPERHADLLLEDFRSRKMVSWQWPSELLPPREEGGGGGRSAMMISPLDDRQPLNFQWAPDQKFILFFFIRWGTYLGGDSFDSRNPIKREFLLNRWKAFVNMVQPEFAILDDYEHCIAPRAGQDLRQYAWGAAVYGPALIEAIGKERFLTIQQRGWAHQVEELPWGGIYLQACEDPFRPDFVQIGLMAGRLGLESTFGRFRPDRDEDD